jgi:hypothetical protein
MKRILYVIFLIIPAMAWAEKPKANPADYTISVHVQSSRIVDFCSDVTQGSNVCSWEQNLTAIIDGKKYELQSGTRVKLLRLGDYKAKITKDDSQNAYEYMRTYEFLFPDGQTRQYVVVGEME